MTEKRTFVNGARVFFVPTLVLVTVGILATAPASIAIATSPEWDDLLRVLASTPRENGSQELLATATWLRSALEQAGWEVTPHWYTAYPYDQRCLGWLLLAGGWLYAVCMWTRRFGLAVASAVVLPALVAIHVDAGVPLAWFAPTSQPNLVARLPNATAVHTLVFTAHFDTKTDVLDHVTRAPILVFAAPAAILMFAIAAGSFVAERAGNLSPGRRTLARLVGWVGGIYGLALALVFSAGAFVPTRSPGALDDGAACAVLVRLARILAAEPPRAVEVQMVLSSAEELAARGVRALLRDWQPESERRRVRVVNLDPIGASSDLQVLGAERGFLRGSAPNPTVVALLDAAYRKLRGQAIPTSQIMGLTDAWMWRARGYEAATVFSAEAPFVIPRGLHSSRDNAARIDRAALDFTLAFLQEVVATAETQAERDPATGARAAWPVIGLTPHPCPNDEGTRPCA